MKKYVLKMDLTIQKIQEQSDKCSYSYESIKYALSNGLIVCLDRSNGKLSDGFSIDCSGSDLITIDTLKEVFELFGITCAKEKLTEAIHKMVETACINPFMSLDTSLFTKVHGNSPLEIANAYKLFLDIKVVDTSSHIVYRSKYPSMSKVIEFINSKGYKVESTEN